MSKTLVLAEKPSVARELGRVLHAERKGSGCLVGNEFIVTWALGHLVTLAQPEHYGSEYKKWSFDTLPMLPKRMELTVIPETSKQYRYVKELLLSKEVASIVIATDAGREGELVARWIIAKSGVKKPIKRLWISSQTDKAIKEGFRNLKDGKEYWNLYRSAESRAEADWLVGLNVTRALTCKYNAQLSAGRVQTPTLALIVDREKEIKAFQPKEFWRLKADFGQFTVSWDNGKGSGAIYDQKTAEDLKRAILNGRFIVSEVQEGAKSVPPPSLYDLTELQRDANKLYHFSPKQTLDLMQKLYESHKVLTYPRTDSRYLSDDIVPSLNERLKSVSFGEFAAAVKDIQREGRSIAKSCVNNQKVTDHHAIIPTEERPNLLKLSAEEKKIYFMVVKRFLAVFYPAYQYKTIKITCVWQDQLFKAGGKTEVAKGWRAVYDLDNEEGEDEFQNLPQLKKGDSFICKNTLVKSDKTKPPSRYTEASLLTAMENPGKYIADKEMKEFIGSGLGTPATRADIIEKLYNVFYMEKRDNVIYPTSKALQLMDLVPPELKEPLLTAKWERELEAIAKGKSDEKIFIGDIRNYATKLVATVKNSSAVYHPDNLTRTPCPQCGKMMLEVNGKRGKMLVCQDRDCGYRKNISLKTNARCPECHKTMDLFGEGEKQMYICSCGFREKAASFHKKRQDQGGNKREVQHYLHNQQQEEELSPLAKALQEAMKKP